MMDILTTLLLFILKSFVVDAEAMVPPPGVTLPKSTSEGAAAASVVIAIDNRAIMVGNEVVASVDEAIASPGMTIESLAARLEAVRAQQAEIARLQGAGALDHRVATIQGDRDIEFRVLQKVMYTLNQTGFENVSLAVIKHS